MEAISRRQFIQKAGCIPLILLSGSGPFTFYHRTQALSLREVREKILEHCEKIRDQEGPYGAYRMGVGQRTDLYASLDVGILRHIMGEVLPDSLSSAQRTAWIDHINSYALSRDGSYTDTYNHSALHANGMVIGALGILGGRQRYNVKLYDAFRTVETVESWLENINWSRQWGASHLFWGGIHCYSLSSHCRPAWLEVVFSWLNRNLDEHSGWWRKGIPHADRHQALGGSVHILPIYQHHNRVFPFPERVIDSVLSLQLPNGRWNSRPRNADHAMHYLELDALYALKYMAELAPNYRRKAVQNAVIKYGELVKAYWRAKQTSLLAQHPHRILSAVGTFGLLHQWLPDQFPDDVQWTDIFSDIRLYNTAAVETD